MADEAVQRSPITATDVSPPYDTTVPDMEGLERWITGDHGTNKRYSKVIARLRALLRRRPEPVAGAARSRPGPAPVRTTITP
ncbi:hypothetical protein GCM10010363_48830 [Streptomyces omiyaensis]|nr:hypothetical protein GCM10010363_48830 [Streptomyces omiyaensis]